ncbi:hypothetical protein FHW69_003786 [Luteibacter sp. Sphag1AF]|uniref:hypothetical protein n=1 Tax=Luteibacter sp. Sphag1AF TaxID=2587031 RepID=UPI0016090AA5|nr:hypothetical protein [Luteibacter sp. Sphag1AF]MBB3229134.1 hypothetical protein [Luteibacter sp. Sphag1AF]
MINVEFKAGIFTAPPVCTLSILGGAFVKQTEETKDDITYTPGPDKIPVIAAIVDSAKNNPDDPELITLTCEHTVPPGSAKKS